eukprot:13200514-Alexandrium_andersonii.AAC.1
MARMAPGTDCSLATLFPVSQGYMGSNKGAPALNAVSCACPRTAAVQTRLAPPAHPGGAS